MPGDLPGVDSDENKDMFVCAYCKCEVREAHHCCGSHGQFILGSCQLCKNKELSSERRQHK